MTTGGFLLRVIRLGFVLIMVLAAAPIHSAFAQAPVKIRVGWITTPASLVPLLFVKPGVTKHHGKSYMFEPIHFASSTLQITALSQGELDLAAFGYSSFPLAIQNAGLSDLRIIADEIQDGAPGYYSTPFFVRKDSGINRVEDMKGKITVTNGLGSGVDIIMRTALHRHGLEVQRDYTMIEAPFPTHKAMLKEHKGDLVVGVLPFSYDPELNDAVEPRTHRAVFLGSAENVHRQERRCTARSAGGLRHNAALVLRSGQPQGGGGDCRALPEATAGGVGRLAKHI